MCVLYFFSAMFVLNFVAQVGYSMFNRVGIYFNKTQEIFHTWNFKQVTQSINTEMYIFIR